MKPRLLILLFILLQFDLTYSQTARIGVHHPSPRLGDIIEIKFTINDTVNKTSIDKNIDPPTGLNINSIGNGSLKFKKIITKVGEYTIGPFSFTIDGKNYTSNLIVLNVAPKLPEDKEGFWIRQVKWNGNDYLIFEQRIDLEKRKSKDIYNDFADLANNLWDEPNIISFRDFFSSSPRQSTEEESEPITVGKKQVIYKLSIYLIKKGKEFKGSFPLQKKNFEKFPSYLSFTDFIIK